MGNKSTGGVGEVFDLERTVRNLSGDSKSSPLIDNTKCVMKCQVYNLKYVKILITKNFQLNFLNFFHILLM